MGNTALLAQSEGLGAAATGEYRGALTATRFSDPQVELEALHTGCGVYDLGYRAKLQISGDDRVRWLNGMVTNNIRDLAVGQGVYAFLLNPQGRILGDLYAHNRGESIVIDTDQSQVEKMLATFDHYIIMDDVEVKNISEQMTALGIAGPRAREVARASGIEIPESAPLQIFDAKCTCDCDCTSCTCVRGENTLHESVNASMSLYRHLFGVPAAEMNIGTPFYGYEWDGTDQLWANCTTCASASWNYGTYIKQRLNQQGWMVNFDSAARSPYLTNSTTPGIITYDDVASTAAKVRWVMKTRKFGGVFTWELSADYDGHSQDLLDAMYGAWR